MRKAQIAQYMALILQVHSLSMLTTESWPGNRDGACPKNFNACPNSSNSLPEIKSNQNQSFAAKTNGTVVMLPLGVGVVQPVHIAVTPREVPTSGKFVVTRVRDVVAMAVVVETLGVVTEMGIALFVQTSNELARQD
jgi:hypothetical protein